MKRLILLKFSVELFLLGTLPSLAHEFLRGSWCENTTVSSMVCVLIATPLGCMIVNTALTEGQIMVPPHRHTSYPRM